MTRVKVVCLPKDTMYPVRDILDLIEGDLFQKALYVSPEVHKRILANFIKPKGFGTACMYGDLYKPEGISATIQKISFIEDLYMIYWMSDETGFIYTSNTISANHDSLLFCIEGEDVHKQEDTLNQLKT